MDEYIKELISASIAKGKENHLPGVTEDVANSRRSERVGAAPYGHVSSVRNATAFAVDDIQRELLCFSIQ
jgi:hypothetical protein